MKKLALLALATSALALGAFANIKANKVTKEERDATIIVKMTTNVENKSNKVLVAQQNSLLNEISRDITSNFKVTSRYSKLFNGFVLEVPSKYVSKIRSLNRVDKVNYNAFIEERSSNDDGVNYAITTSKENGSASAQTMEKPDGTNDGAGTFIAILDSSFYIQTDEEGKQTYHEVFSELKDEDAVLSQADIKARIDAADKFHGMYDDNHSTYYNNKVVYYYDYGGDQSGATTPDFDVYAEGQDHGTHVASIAGGNAGEAYEGVAPRAQMALMKVFRTYMSGQTYKSGAPDDAVLNALEDCLVLGVDTINMSLGTNLDDFDDNDIVEEAIRKLEAKGTFVNVAAGNEGKGNMSGNVYRYWTTDMVETNIISAYANNLAANTVASAQADFQFYGEALTIDGHNIRYADEVTNYNTVDGPVTYEPERHLKDLVEDYGTDEFDFVYFPGLGAIEEYEGIDVSGKIAVVNRGDITFREKVDNAISKGAIAVGIIDNTTATDFNIRMSFGNDNYTPAIPVVFFLSADQEIFANSESNKAKFLINVDLDNPTARTISDYSSDGMRYDLSIKPEIAAPGENIKGAVLGATDKYESMSGTSMATPNITGVTALMLGEHLGDEAYRETINARMMSTAHPMKDATPEANYTSVRRQGAGLVNIDGALNSKVYLDGIDGSGNQIGKAKVELFNNDDIKEGKLNIKFAAINEGNETKTYKATTYVMAPGTDTYSDEIYPQFAGQKFQTIQDQLVEVFEDDVTVPANATTVVALPEHQIDKTKLAAINEDFDEGFILEGYTILTAENEYQLSIPFLGFYGDLSQASPVEPFDFEKEDGRSYTSDLLNYLIAENIQTVNDTDYTKADFRSHMVSGYWKSRSNVKVGDAITYNTTNLLKMTDENSNKLRLVGQNPYDGSLDANKLFVGNNGYSNTLVIQQYVKRSVFNNTITLTNKATGEVILIDHMFDNLMGSNYDASTLTTTYPLYKSHLDLTALYDGGYFAHKAYSVIPLYNNDGLYPDGEYEMKFSYDMALGATYEKSFTLTIESEIPTVTEIERDDDNYRIHYTDTNLSVLYVNEKPYAPTKDENGVYVDVPASLFEESDKAMLKSVDAAFGEETYLTHLDDRYNVMLYNKLFTSSYDFSYVIERTASNDQKITFDITKNGKAGTTSGKILYKMRVPAGLDINSLQLYSVDGKGKEKAQDFTRSGDFIKFESTIKIFHMVSNYIAPELYGIDVESPLKTSYLVGENLDLTGLVVYLLYTDDSSEVLETGYTVSDVDMSTPGTKKVSVSYQDFTVSFTIEVSEAPVVELASISVSGPTKTEYSVNDKLDLAGLVVTANYSDGSTNTITDYIVSDVDMTTAGTKTVTVTYEGKTATFTITVKEGGDTPTPSKKGGCGGSIIASSAIISISAALGFGLLMLRKRKEK